MLSASLDDTVFRILYEGSDQTLCRFFKVINSGCINQGSTGPTTYLHFTKHSLRIIVRSLISGGSTTGLQIWCEIPLAFLKLINTTDCDHDAGTWIELSPGTFQIAVKALSSLMGFDSIELSIKSETQSTDTLPVSLTLTGFDNDGFGAVPTVHSIRCHWLSARHLYESIQEPWFPEPLHTLKVQQRLEIVLQRLMRFKSLFMNQVLKDPVVLISLNENDRLDLFIQVDFTGTVSSRTSAVLNIPCEHFRAEQTQNTISTQSTQTSRDTGILISMNALIAAFECAILNPDPVVIALIPNYAIVIYTGIVKSSGQYLRDHEQEIASISYFIPRRILS